MGEVYKARDARLRRDIALKTISSPFATDAEHLRRFEQEALATAQINHPNIVTVYDVGAAEGVTYVVSELIPGQTLRELLKRGPLPVRTTIEYGVQIANGLAAAHEHGIVHRDLKPENILVTEEGAVKIVDFGLAKLAASWSGPEGATAVAETKPGIVMGTAGYMAPEQARGQDIDHRADIFSFGAVLYEMLSGHRAFDAETGSDLLAAILTSQPPPIERAGESIPPALEQILRHCLDKNRDRRFQSARDVMFALETLLSPSGSVSVPVIRHRWPWRTIAAAATAAIIAALATYVVLRARIPHPLHFQQVSFRRGTIQWGRFSPDGHMFVYGAAWEGKPFEIFSGRADSPESRPLDLQDADVASISSSGEMLVLLHPRPDIFISRLGTLARVPLAGGTPHEIMESVNEADWAPDGSKFAVVLNSDGKSRLEYPSGNVLFSTAGWITHARVSPDGKMVAFLHHPVRPDDGGEVAVVDLERRLQILSRGWVSIEGLAWAGDEILFTGAHAGLRALYRVRMNGELRTIAEVPGSLILLDVSRSGQLLLIEENLRTALRFTTRSERIERDLGWLDVPAVRDISTDGRMILFDESGAGGGPTYAVYVRKTDGSPAIRLGEGVGCSFSPDERSVMSFDPHQNPSPLTILPIGAGQPRQIATPGLHHENACWLPDGRTIAFIGVEKGHGPRLYVQNLESASPRPFTPEGVRAPLGRFISPDGRYAATTSPTRRISIYSLDGKEPPIDLVKLTPGVRFCGWSSDSRFLFAATISRQWNIAIDRVEVRTGNAQRWAELQPADVSGLRGGGTVKITPDGNAIVYSINRSLCSLYLADQIR